MQQILQIDFCFIANYEHEEMKIKSDNSIKRIEKKNIFVSGEE